MTDLAERLEIGSLYFEMVTVPRDDEVALTPVFEQVASAWKLVIEESGTTAESGIALTAASGHELILVAADFPYALAIKGLPLDHYTFRSEYPLDTYTRILMA